MKRQRHLFGALGACVLLLAYAMTAHGAEKSASAAARFQGPPDGWSTFVRGGAVNQFDTDIDDDGGFGTQRFYFQGGATYTWDRRNSVSLALGYGRDGYHFDGSSGFGALSPWEDIHGVDVAVPVRYGLNRKWTAFVVPSVRVNAEDGAETGDATTGGVLGGAAYRVGDRLTLGPGIGVVTQIEDDVEVFPILLIDWRITDAISLTTGRAVGATLGPGLQLVWAPDRNWEFSFGGRYERLRFRLDKDGPAPEGVGDDRAFPMYAGFRYSFTPLFQVSVIGGVELGGELLLEDRNGNLVRKSGYGTAGFLGGAINLRF